MFKMRNNSTTEMNFRCVEVRVRKQEDFLAKPEQEERVEGGGSPPTKIDSPHQIFVSFYQRFTHLSTPSPTK